MSITSVNSTISIASTAAVTATQTQSDTSVNNEPTISSVKNADNEQNTGTTAKQNQPSENEVKNITEELNNFMQSINTDIKFELHTKTNTLMIQVVDNESHKVLKEVPSHELLDMVAKMRECIGALVDKKV